MAKLLLVEDDNNLREIYEARLQAEGYTIVSAKDGEEALVVAKAEKPDLVIADVMMPKISGFEMLDILRNTDELKNVKVIMLTALGQSDDQQRADKLGADRYLVKSQVTLEDIVKVAHELLEGEDTPAATPATTPAAEDAPADSPAPESKSAPTPDATSKSDNPDTSTSSEVATPTVQEEADVEAKIEDFVAGASSEPTTPGSDSTAAPADEPATDTPAPPASDGPTDSKSTASASDDKLMADAVEQLVASTDKSDGDAAAKPAEDTDTSALPAPASKSTAIPVSVVPDDNSAAPTVAPTDDDTAKEKPDTTASGSGSVSHTKVIKPLESGEPKKDIKELLADEEANEAHAVPGATITGGASKDEGTDDRPSGQPPASPGSTIPAGTKDAGKGEVDPNSIAL
jgi:CheY-like chemotaxis protein